MKGKTMPTFRVREGRRFGADKQFGPGDLVTLETYEAAGFLDKLEVVIERVSVPPSQPKDSSDGKPETLNGPDAPTPEGDEETPPTLPIDEGEASEKSDTPPDQGEEAGDDTATKRKRKG
jgi:hypothetical protein